MVSVSNISKNFGPVRALNSVSFEVEAGELYGIIGPDGAGKTTLFRILTTLMLADSGAAVVDGSDVQKDYKLIRRKIGYMPGRFSLYQDLSVEENLQFFATIFGTTIQENYHLIKDIYRQIEPFKKRRAGKLSGGMKQKLALSCALIHKPTVLFLDEPTTGVDPVSRKEFWEMLGNLKRQGITILVSTPYMDEATLCDRIALMQEGEFLQVDTPQHIIEQFPDTLWAVQSSDMFRLLNDLRSYRAIKTCFTFGETHHVTLNNGEWRMQNGESRVENAEWRMENGGMGNLRRYLEGLGHENIEIKEIKPSVEDCFMRLATQEK